jgi:solute carrier family 39 (zinc transporter), member 7
MISKKYIAWAFVALVAFASAELSKRSYVENLTRTGIEDSLHQCPFVRDVDQYKIETTPPTSSLVSRIFKILYPGSPAVNALLATAYISGPPNFLLALCPPNVDPNSLSIMVAFAVGGLMGDTIFHLLPEIFLGEDALDHARFVMVDTNKNLLLGVAIIVGFMTFVAMDKALRIATGGEGGHDHSHTHSAPEPKAITTGSKSSALAASSANGELRARKQSNKKQKDDAKETTSQSSTSIRLSAYLNLIADFTHNITDGLALSSSFYASSTLGATTTAAVFFHEIPHEVGDFALLIQSGFSKRQAMGAQFVTAVGAFLGTFIGIAVQELGKADTSAGSDSGARGGLFGTELSWGDMLLPFTAGTFLYVGTVAVIPELLETGPNKRAETWKTVKQFAAITVGAGIMLG